MNAFWTCLGLLFFIAILLRMSTTAGFFPQNYTGISKVGKSAADDALKCWKKYREDGSAGALGIARGMLTVAIQQDGVDTIYEYIVYRPGGEDLYNYMKSLKAA